MASFLSFSTQQPLSKYVLLASGLKPKRAEPSLTRTLPQPIVLNLYERFYLPLQASLRPAIKAFILALLPGLEEETGEFFEKVRISLLARLDLHVP